MRPSVLDPYEGGGRGGVGKSEWWKRRARSATRRRRIPRFARDDGWGGWADTESAALGGGTEFGATNDFDVIEEGDHGVVFEIVRGDMIQDAMSHFGCGDDLDFGVGRLAVAWANA
jgi:hypothetical protein